MTRFITIVAFFLMSIIGKVYSFTRLGTKGGSVTIRSLAGFGSTWKPTSRRASSPQATEREDYGHDRNQRTVSSRESTYSKDSFSRDRKPARRMDDSSFNRKNHEFAGDRRQSRPYTEKAPFSEGPRRSSYSSDSSRSNHYDRSARPNSYDRPYQPRWEKEEKTEPTYGYYDGDHVYGVSSVRLALLSGRRQIKELLVQEGMDLSNKKDSKTPAEIFALAEKNNIEIREFSKHDLNMLTDNKPHQGFVLRAQPLGFTKLTTLEPSTNYSCVLALDEVWDPQNFGALLRTAYFLRCDKVVVCSKNSAPLSPAVSKASAGAMELMKVYSTDNLMKFLDSSKNNGWQVVGTDLNPKSVSLYEVPRTVPTILVLGNEGHGIRTNILRRCTHLVRLGNPLLQGGAEETTAADVSESVALEDDSSAEGIADDSRSGDDDSVLEKEAVDSLNVSVTGAIILHHFLASK